MVQHWQINQCDIPHQEVEEQKPFDHLNKGRKKAFDKIQHQFTKKLSRK